MPIVKNSSTSLQDGVSHTRMEVVGTHEKGQFPQSEVTYTPQSTAAVIAPIDGPMVTNVEELPFCNGIEQNDQGKLTVFRSPSAGQFPSTPNFKRVGQLHSKSCPLANISYRLLKKG